MKITPDAQTAIEVIRSLGGRPLLVGGCVRDMILGIESKDIDIEVHGPCSYLHLVEALGERGWVDTVGAAFGVIKFASGSRMTPVDISFPRRDSKTRGGHTGFMIDVDPTMSVEEALSRRDFTINSIAFDPATEEFIDPFDGRKHLVQRTLRHTSDAFVEDPLRVMRAIQFAARFKFLISADTAALCRTLVDEFHELSVERIWVEWEKIFSKGKSMVTVTTALRDTGWGTHFTGWMLGSPEATDRTLELAGQVEPARRAALILGAQFLGRPTALQGFLVAIDAPHDLRKWATTLATDIKVEGTQAQQVRQMARILKGVTLEDYFLVRQRRHVSLYTEAVNEQVIFAADPPLLTGDDLKAFGLEPGPQFGTILAAAIKQQDLVGWLTKAEAFEWFKERE